MCYKELRRRVLERDGHKCVWCGVGASWNDKPLTLQVDHIDGDRRNNSEENLRTMCPNCHSQTDTYTFNKTKSDFDNRLKKYLEGMTKEQIQKFFLDHTHKEIVDITETCLRSLRKYIKENGIISRHKVVAQGKMVYLNKEELRELLNKKSFVEIGKMYGVSEACVRKIAKKHGLYVPRPYRKFNSSLVRKHTEETKIKISGTLASRWEYQE